MRFRFIGKHSGGRTSITVFGVTFDGVEPAEVEDPEAIRRLSGNREFETVKGRPAKKKDEAE